MEFHSFTVRCNPGERKIYISSDEEFEYKIIIKSICSNRVLWDSVHQIPQIGPVWISPSNSDGDTYTDPRFGTCKEAIKNGYGPYYDGVDEEYDWYRDADSDGAVCER